MTLPSTGSDRCRGMFLPALLTGLLTLSGCAQLQSLKTRVERGLGGRPATATTVTPPSPPPPKHREKAPPPARPPAEVLSRDVQYGHYEAAREDLQRYLQLHPGDRAAKALLHQLTADPQAVLGHRSRPYTVRPGDSYGSLAQRFLGSASRFVILARYNHATDPSKLSVGQTVRLPLSAGSGHGSPSGTAHGNKAPRPVAHTSKAGRAERLQKQSVSLLAQGHRKQAMKQLGRALRIDPKLPTDGPKSTALRKELLASYHQQAIVLYRDQHLDRAIALWDHVLAIDPHYESARVYRARAEELKQRLRKLN